MRLVLDAHGGDQAPQVVLASLERAAPIFPEVTFLVVGTSDIAIPSFPNIKHIQAEQVISSAEDPVSAVRGKPRSSLVIGCSLLREGKADAFLSAGNTGALLVAGLYHVGRIEGVARPALSLWYPSFSGTSSAKLVLDVGANPDAKPQHLLQYALMGSTYVTHVIGRADRPRVALLNIGTEPNKGSERLRRTHAVLAAEERLCFVGNVEARDIMKDVCDVLVTDGLGGNILLKGTEGVASAIAERLRQEFTTGLRGRLAGFALRSRLRNLQAVMNYQKYGGAPLLGLSAPVIKVHGSASEQAWLAALRQAQVFVERGIMKRMAGVIQPEVACSTNLNE